MELFHMPEGHVTILSTAFARIPFSFRARASFSREFLSIFARVAFARVSFSFRASALLSRVFLSLFARVAPGFRAYSFFLSRACFVFARISFFLRACASLAFARVLCFRARALTSCRWWAFPAIEPLGILDDLCFADHGNIRAIQYPVTWSPVVFFLILSPMAF